PVDLRLLRACYLAGFCWFCCLLPKNEPARLRANVIISKLETGALVSGMPRRLMPSPSSGADPDKLVECACERRLVIESRLNRDVDQRHAGLAHQLFGVVNAFLNNPLG